VCVNSLVPRLWLELGVCCVSVVKYIIDTSPQASFESQGWPGSRAVGFRVLSKSLALALYSVAWMKKDERGDDDDGWD
jgi:hypothetical protein